MNEATLQGSNINLVKLHNLRVVLLSLLREPSLSRVQIARQTQLSNTTITNIINELLQQGILLEDANDAPVEGELRPVGRPRTSLQLVPDARLVVGIHIGVGIHRVAAAEPGKTRLTRARAGDGSSRSQCSATRAAPASGAPPRSARA